MPSVISQYLTHLSASGFSKQTIELRKSQIARFEKAIGHEADSATLEEIENYIAHAGSAREYRRSLKSALAKYFAYIQALGVRSDNPVVLMGKIKPMPPRPHPASDIAYYAAKRDASPDELIMLRLAAEYGLRRGEVAQVHKRDIWKDLLGWTLTVHGKGERDREVPLTDEFARSILARIDEQGGGFLFPGAVDGHMSAAWIGKRISRLLPEGVTMHALRHRFATKIYTQSLDLFATQRLLGHASPATTQLYVATDAARLREVARAAL